MTGEPCSRGGPTASGRRTRWWYRGAGRRPWAALSAGEADDGPGHLALLHGVVAVVHLVEGDRAGDHLVEQQAAVEVHADHVGHVHPELVRAHHRALQL